MSKLNTDDCAQWSTLDAMQTSPINTYKPELLTFPKLALSVFFITVKGTASSHHSNQTLKTQL